ncbi:MAG: hypothetical protein ABIA74_04940 [bacterium]
MNTRVIIMCVFFSNLVFFATPLWADLQQDQKTGRFYSVPFSSDINQNEYNDLMQLCCIMCQACLTYSIFKATNAETIQMLSSYLQTIGTPTSKRLIADIQKEATPKV